MGNSKHARYWWNLCINGIRACLLGFVFLTSLNAGATVTYSPTYSENSYNKKFSSPEEGLAWAKTVWTNYTASTFNLLINVSVSGYQIRSGTTGLDYIFATCASAGVVNPVLTFTASEQSCRAPTCPSGQTANASGTCVINGTIDCSSRKNNSYYSFSGTGMGALSPQGNSCENGSSCEVFVKFNLVNNYSSKGFAIYGTYTGNACTPVIPPNSTIIWTTPTGPIPSGSPANPPTPAATAATASPVSDPQWTDEAKCIQNGQNFGTVNGAVICTAAAAGSSSTSQSTSTKTNPDGTAVTTTTTKTSTSNPDGTVTTGTSSTQSGTGTTGTTSGSGTSPAAGTTTGTSTQDKQSFCAENPTSIICKESSFSGSCGATPACTGDAIQCAMAADQIKRNCTLFDNKTTLSDLGQTLADGTDPNADKSPFNDSNKTKISLGGADGTLDQARLWGGSCIPNQNFTVMGQSFSLDTSRVCGAIELFGNLFVAITMIGAAMIIGKGV